MIASLTKIELYLIERITIESLIILAVHCRDILDFLITEKINKVYDFDWMKQLRMYNDINDNDD